MLGEAHLSPGRKAWCLMFWADAEIRIVSAFRFCLEQPISHKGVARNDWFFERIPRFAMWQHSVVVLRCASRAGAERGVLDVLRRCQDPRCVSALCKLDCRWLNMIYRCLDLVYHLLSKPHLSLSKHDLSMCKLDYSCLSLADLCLNLVYLCLNFELNLAAWLKPA